MIRKMLVATAVYMGRRVIKKTASSLVKRALSRGVKVAK